jgi:hypothetical protein
MAGFGMGPSNQKQGPVSGYCEYGNEPSGSIKGVNRLSNWAVSSVLKKECVTDSVVTKNTADIESRVILKRTDSRLLMAKVWVRLQDSGVRAGSAATNTVSSTTNTPYLSVTVLQMCYRHYQVARYRTSTLMESDGKSE